MKTNEELATLTKQLRNSAWAEEPFNTKHALLLSEAASAIDDLRGRLEITVPTKAEFEAEYSALRYDLIDIANAFTAEDVGPRLYEITQSALRRFHTLTRMHYFPNTSVSYDRPQGGN